MNSITIDKFDIKVHERYAKDQEKLDPGFIKDAHTIPPHSEITGTSIIYASKWEELFETQMRNISWAAFPPPPKFTIQARRFFSHRIIPSIHLGDETADEEEQQKQDEEREKEQKNLFEAILEVGKEKKTTIHTEKERTVVLSLLDSIKMLNKLLAIINARKLQYQKG